MRSMTIETPLAASRPAVFEFLSDIEQQQLWRREVVSMRRLPGARRGLGARYLERLWTDAGRAELDVIVNRFDPPSQLEYVATSDRVTYLMCFELMERGPRTMLKTTLSLHTGNRVPPEQADAVWETMTRCVRRALGRLRLIMEEAVAEGA